MQLVLSNAVNCVALASDAPQPEAVSRQASCKCQQCPAGGGDSAGKKKKLSTKQPRQQHDSNLYESAPTEQASGLQAMVTSSITKISNDDPEGVQELEDVLLRQLWLHSGVCCFCQGS
uniref:Uncharacterized protein n=1 Tax=Tetradesmus obliquus TaxID=3088 RepID=A0A383V4E0_TETOB|eukprot:jgi/Sobl393_1/1330/SZX59803.1